MAASDGIFEGAGAWLAQLPGGGVWLLICVLGLIAACTVVLNLDTSVVFLTPIALHTARARGIDERAFLYGAVLMSNSASLLLPGSNLTNLLILGGDHVSGASFAARLFPAWAAAVMLTAAVLIGWRWRDLRAPRQRRLTTHSVAVSRAGLGALGMAAATALVLILSEPALPVLGLGMATAGGQVALRRLDVRAVRVALDVPTLAALFVLASGVGLAARLWTGPAQLVRSLQPWQSASLGAATAVVINNLPAAMLLASTPPAHARALLLGLNLGPNLALTGSLSAILWLRVARATGARPSAWTYSRLGAAVVPLSVSAGLLALLFFAPRGLPV